MNWVDIPDALTIHRVHIERW